MIFLKKIKKIYILSFLIILAFSLIGCGQKVDKKNFLTLGISAEIPEDITFSYSKSEVFNYENTTIPTISIQGVNKTDTILFKSFPFTTDDYKKHFKSAFSSNDLKTIKYDYDEVKSFDEIDKIYKSKAILEKDGEKKYSYVYLISFKNTSGTLIVETTSSKDKDFMDIIKSLKTIKTKVENIENTNSKFDTKRDFKDVKIVENITVPMPSTYNIKESKTSNAFYINGFGKNEAMYVIASKSKPVETTALTWNNINGYEVLKKFSNDNYLVSDLNTQALYNLTTEIKEVYSSTGQKYYLRIEKLNSIKK